MKRVNVIVPAAGEGKRFGSSEKKTFFSIKGIPLIIHTLRRLAADPLVDSILPVVGQEDIKRLNEMIGTYGLEKVKKAISGGVERQDSVYNGLRFFLENMDDPQELIMIHDGARPLIPDGLIAHMVRELLNDPEIDGIIPGIRLTDTIKETDDKGFIKRTLDRESLIAVQTPQLFKLGILEKAYRVAYEKGIYATDDSSLVEQIGGRVKIIDGSVKNLKITKKEDIGLLYLYMEGEIYDQDWDWF